MVIPKLNQRDLMLKKDVIDAVKSGRFHIYAVSTIDEGIELLSGVKAGKRLKSGRFQAGTINYRVDEKLTRYAEQIKDYYETGDDNG